MNRALAAALLATVAAAVADGQCPLDLLNANDAAENDLFGAFSVAIAGDTAVVGASEDDDAGEASGAAYVFTRAGSAFVPAAKLLALDAALGDQLGRAVACAAGVAVAGAPNDDDAGSSSGAAYVFEDTGAGWIQAAKLRASDGAFGHGFGTALSISEPFVLVGAPQSSPLGVQGPGAAYIFERTPAGFVERAKLVPSDGVPGDAFGFAVALSGTRALVGAPAHAAAGAQSGASYVFELAESGWVQRAKLQAGDGAPGDNLGFSVSLAGAIALVGAPRDDTFAGTDAGSAYVFEESGGVWTQAQKLLGKVGEAAPSDQLGLTVSVAGNRAVVGAPFDDDPFAGTDAGLAYAFERGAAGFALTQVLEAQPAKTGDLYGRAVAVSAAAVTLVAAPFDDELAPNAGVVYAYVDLPRAALQAYGCGPNPAGSLALVEPPAIAAPLVFFIDNPLGTQAAGAASFVALGVAPAPAFPCGTLLPGTGMAGPGAPGELLLDPAAGFVVRAGTAFGGPGLPASAVLFVPGNCALVGKRVYAQGALLDPGAPLGVELGLTDALELSIGP